MQPVQSRRELENLLPEGCLFFDEPMKKHTSFRIGGQAEILVLPQTNSQIIAVIDYARRQQIPYIIMGNGTNLLVKDGGIRGIVIKLAKNFGRISLKGQEMNAQAGASLNGAAELACRKGLKGLEFAAGIPGTFGGAVSMNAGAYDGEMKDVITSATVLKQDNAIEVWSAEELGFAYRKSRVITEGAVLLEVTLHLEKDDPAKIRERMNHLLSLRKAKQPLQYPSAGSTFKRPPGHYAGALIEKAGLKGFRIGDAQVSPLHAGFIINLGNATARDVIRLIEAIQEAVLTQFGILLEPEVRIVGEEIKDRPD
ncbi:MAG: UDP-N-acetylmuramate dehydrogenase [Limnochordia bacterium]